MNKWIFHDIVGGTSIDWTGVYTKEGSGIKQVNLSWYSGWHVNILGYSTDDSGIEQVNLSPQSGWHENLLGYTLKMTEVLNEWISHDRVGDMSIDWGLLQMIRHWQQVNLLWHCRCKKQAKLQNTCIWEQKKMHLKCGLLNNITERQKTDI